MNPVSYEIIKNNSLINDLIKSANDALVVMGYTEHSTVHAGRVSFVAGDILEKLGFSERECELVKIAGYMHDIGNGVNRENHAQTGAAMAFKILLDMGMNPAEVGQIISAIGNHHETDGCAVSNIAAALIIADKSDVRRSRVTNRNMERYDIHDRVNYAVKHSNVEINAEERTISLVLEMDSEMSSPMEYLEIFMHRMIMARKAAEFIKTKFKLIINNAEIL